MDLFVYPDPSAAASAAAHSIADLLGVALDERGVASLAVSGGSTAPPMLDQLFAVDLDWSRVELWQVDERVAPDGDPSRNADQIGGAPAIAHLMPVTSPDLVAAAAAYAESLPPAFDVVHLGLGPDGHTASWPPDQPDVPVSNNAVVVTAPFNGQLRMTLTESVVNGARSRVLLAVGESKSDPLQRWLLGDSELPISRVSSIDTAVFVDRAASPADAVLTVDNPDD